MNDSIIKNEVALEKHIINNKNKLAIILMSLGVILVFVGIILSSSTSQDMNMQGGNIIHYTKYSGAYLSDDDVIRLDKNNNIEYIEEPITHTKMQYNYEYDNDLVSGIRYEGILDDNNFYGRMEFLYNDKMIESITATNYFAGIEYKYQFDYEFDEKNRLTYFHQKKEVDGTAYFSYCSIAYYQEYAIEECVMSHNLSHYFMRNIYLYDELEEDEKTIWNLYQISPVYLYDYGYYNINNSVAAINIQTIRSLYYLGKEIYSYHQDYDNINGNPDEVYYYRYFDKEGRILKVRLLDYSNIETYYMYKDGKVSSLSHDNIGEEIAFTLSQYEFDGNKYSVSSKLIDNDTYHEYISQYEEYFNQNVIEYPIEEITDNLSKIYKGTYNVTYYEYPEVYLERYYDDTINYNDEGPQNMNFDLDEVNDYVVKLNGNDITDECSPNQDDSTKVRCYIVKDYIKINEINKVDFIVSNAKYKDIVHTFNVNYTAKDLDFNIYDANDNDFFQADKSTIEFYNYGKSIKASTYILSLTVPKGPITYEITMEDVNITKKADYDGYSINLDLSAFEEERFDKSSHIATVTITDRYGRNYSKHYEFVYK